MTLLSTLFLIYTRLRLEALEVHHKSADPATCGAVINIA